VHFEGLRTDCRTGQSLAAAMVNGAQRLDSPLGLGDDTIGLGPLSGVQKLAEKTGCQTRHVAGYDKIPVGSRGFEGRPNAAQRAAAFGTVGFDGQAQATVSRRRSDYGDVPGRLTDAIGDPFEQGNAAEVEQGFIAPHAGAQPAREHKSRAALPALSAHEMMLTGNFWRHIVLRNKKVYICFLLGMLATSPIPAADSATQPPAASKSSVVRVDPRTGKLVRSVTAAPQSHAPAQQPISDLVEKSAKAHQVDPLLVHSIIKVESNYDPNAISRKGAQGLMQLMPGTARDLGVTDSFDPGQNIEAGVRYLKELQDFYKDDRLALAAYNAGPGAVNKYKQIPPIAETQNYVKEVSRRYQQSRPQASSEAALQKQIDPPAPEHNKLEHFVDQNGRLYFRTVSP